MTETSSMGAVLGSVAGCVRRNQGWIAVLVGAAAFGCSHQEHPEIPPPPQVLSPECLEYAHVQESLAELGLQAMQSLGRIDPKVYVRSEQGELQPSPELGSASPQQRTTFEAALARVKADPKARAALERGYAYASAGCAYDGCSATAYTISVERTRTNIESDKLYRWKVSGQAPTASEWKAFESLYAPRPAFCPVLASIVLHTPSSGVAQTSGLFDEEHRTETSSFTNPCKCHYNGQPGKPASPCTYCSGFAGVSCPTDI